MEEDSFRLAIFGPGIESRRNKKFIFKMINAHNSSLNAKTFVPGLPGGMGSGVRIDFNNLYTFDLICLYTNTLRLRQTLSGHERLEAANNRLLKRDVKGTKLQKFYIFFKLALRSPLPVDPSGAR